MASITSKTSVSDAIVEAVRSFFNPVKNRDLSEIENAQEAEAIAQIRVNAEFYGDQYSVKYMEYRNREMLNVGRKNAELLTSIVKGVKEEEVDDMHNKNLGVKKELDKLVGDML